MKEYLPAAKQYWNAIGQGKDTRIHIADEWAKTESILELIESHNNDWDAVIEIGSGIGRLLAPLADKHKEGSFLGVDIAAEMINKAEKRDNINYTTVFLAGGSKVSLIYSFLVFQHIPHEEKVKYIQKSYKTLKPGGKLLFQFVKGTENDPFSYQTSLKKMKSELTKAGFTKITSQKEFLHKDWIVVSAIKL